MDFADNGLLAALPMSARQRLKGLGRRVSLRASHVLQKQGKPIKFVYFPTSAVISLMEVIQNGASIEVAAVGREGMLGVSISLGAERAAAMAIVQVPGQAIRMKIEDFKQTLAQDAVFNTVLRRYLLTRVAYLYRSAACSRFHSAKERLARWILTTHDRASTDEFPFTQALLARMLGIRRPSVSVVASELQKDGLIRYSRGKIKIIDRRGLEDTTCECYRVIKERSLISTKPQ